MKKPFYKIMYVVALVLSVSGVIYAGSVWAPPTGAPPSNNVDAPINVGSIEQTKTGRLNVDSRLKAGQLYITGDACSGLCGTGLYIQSGNIKIGNGAVTTDGTNMSIAAPSAAGGIWLQNSDGTKSYMSASTWGTVTNGELVSATSPSVNYASLRMIAGGKSAMLRNDSVNTFFLFSDTEYGAWNNLRPLYINNSTGVVSISNGLVIPVLSSGSAPQVDGSIWLQTN